MHMGANTSRCWRGYAAGQGNDMWNDALLHILGVVGTRLRKAAGVCDTVLDRWASRACRSGAFADLRDSRSANPALGPEERVVTLHTCPTSGGG